MNLHRTLTRRGLIGSAVALGAALAAGRAAARAVGPVSLLDLRVSNGGSPFAGDNDRLATLSPAAAARARASAVVTFGLHRPADVKLEVVNRGEERGTVLATQETRLGRGRHELSWTAPRDLAAATYLLRLTASDRSGRKTIYGISKPGQPPKGPLVRILGVDAAFAARSYTAGERADLVVATDAQALTVQLFRCGSEPTRTYRNDELLGVPVSDPATVTWTGNGGGPAPIPVAIGQWPSGVYFARLAADDGRVGFAPFVVRPATPSQPVAVVMPTNTWQAYNRRDTDADGWGDTWYASWRLNTVDLTRPHERRGVPYRFRSYDLGFLRWLAARGHGVDFYAEEDLERFATAEELRAPHRLLVFPGHTEYVTEHAFDLVEHFRDLGGNLLLLSANNFFRKVELADQRLELIGLWRDLGRPESRTLGVQYLANDRGKRQAPFTVVGADAAPWAFAGTGLGNGSTFGRYGIEIDARTPESPPGTQVLAHIPDLLGPGRTAEMTYYETPAGARVFSGGVLNFGGQIDLWPEVSRLIDNVWARLTA